MTGDWKPLIVRAWNGCDAFVWVVKAAPPAHWGMGVSQVWVHRWRRAWSWCWERNSDAPSRHDAGAEGHG